MPGYDDIIAQMKGSQAATGTAPAPYDAAAAQLADANEQSRAQAALAVSLSADQNPDEAAQHAALAKRYNTTPDVVSRFPAEFKQRFALEQARETLAKAPVLQAAVGGNPATAAMVHDDLHNAAGIEQAANAPRPTPVNDAIEELLSTINDGYRAASGAVAPVFGITARAAGAPFAAFDALAGTHAADVPFSVARWFDEYSQNYPLDHNGNFVKKLAQTAGSTLGLITEAMATGGEAPIARAGAGIMEALLPHVQHGVQAMLVPSAVASNQVAQQVLDRGGSIADATKAGVASYVTNTLGGVVPFATPGKLVYRLGTGAVSGVLLAENSRNLMNWALPEEMRSAPATNEDRSLDALTGAIFGGLVGPKSPAHDLMRQARAAAQAHHDYMQIGALGELSASSKWRERDPEGFRNFVETVTEDGALPNVYIEGKVFAQALDKAGVDAQELAAKVPELAGQMREALETGGYVRIPTADYATSIAGTPLDAQILQHLKVDPEGKTYAEAQEFYQTQADQMKEVAAQLAQQKQQADAFRQSQAVVLDQVHQQLDALGRFPSDVNKVNATITTAVLSRIAAHEGITPEQAMAKYGAKVVAQTPAGAQLDQFVPLKQDMADVTRGSFNPETTTLALLKNADLSTYLHETGHWALDAYSRIAKDPQAPAPIREDMDKVLKWFGVESLDKWHSMTLDEQRVHHEKFARGFEAYLMEGKAPSQELQPFFARIRSWLVNIYRDLRALNVPLTSEVRGVFDRMLASEEAIKEAQAARVFEPLFKEKPAGMTAEEWAAYQDLGAKATDDAIDEMQRKSLRDMKWLSGAKSKALKAAQKQADVARKETRAEVEKQVGEEPVYRMQDWLKANKVTKDKIDPEMLAEMFGFKTGDEALRALAEAPPRAEVIEGLTDRYMLERHGELATPDAIERAANDAVHNEARARFVATGLKVLTKSPVPARELVRGAKEAADAAIAGQKVRNLSPRQYEAAEAKANRDALKLVAKDPAAAAQAQRASLLNNQLVKSTHQAIADVQKGLEYFGKFAKDSVREKIDVAFRDQIDQLLARYDLRKGMTPEQAFEKNIVSLEAFVEKLAAMKFSVDVPERMIVDANRTHFKDMTVEDFRGLVDAVKSLEHLGREVQKVTDGTESRMLADVASEAVAQTEKLPKRTAETNRGLSRIAEKWIGLKSQVRSLQASLLKMEQMIDWLDDYNPKGVFNRMVFRKIADAEGRRNDLDLRISKAWESHVAKLPKEVLKEGRRVYTMDGVVDGLTGEPQRLTWGEKIALAGIRGDAQHFSKLLKGEKWDAQAVLSFLDRNMSKAEWDFVRGIADTFQDIFPLKQQMLRDLGSTAPKEVERIPFQTPHGEHPGWYWPITYDPARSHSVKERHAKHEASLFEDNIYTRADTSTGREQTRNDNYAKPMLLSIDVLPRVLKDEIRDVTMRKAIIEADRFLSHPDVRRSITDVLSPEHYDQFNGWLLSLANDAAVKPSELRMWDRLAHEIRTRTTMVGLGFRVSTMIMHGTTAAGESIAEAGVKTMAKGILDKKTWAGLMGQLGPEWMNKGIESFTRDSQWVANRDFIVDRSAEMRHRMNEVERDVREQLRAIHLELMDPATGAAERAKLAINSRAYQGIAMLDMASALPTWMGAYLKAMSPKAKGGLEMNEQDAVYFADKTVRNAHGGGGVKDMAAIQRGTEFQKLFTMFYTFWNHNINRIIDTAKRVKELPRTYAEAGESGDWAGFRGDVGTLILRTFMYTLGVQAVHHMMHPPKEGEGEEGWVKWFAKQMSLSAFGGVPLARDVVGHYAGGKDYEMSPVASIVQNTDRLVKDFQDGSTHERWIKHAMTEAGYILGMPLGQPASTAQFMSDVWDGKQHPQDIAEWWRGVTTGDMNKH